VDWTLSNVQGYLSPFVINQGLLVSKHDTRYKKSILVEIIHYCSCALQGGNGNQFSVKKTHNVAYRW
jgi:hypothetical protein